MGYWKTHAGLDAPSRDATYDVLNGAEGFIFLGVPPYDGYPEQQVDDPLEAKTVFDVAEASTDNAVLMVKAQLLAAKLNDLKYPWFADVHFLDVATLSTGEVIETFGDAIDAGDQILDDIANGITRQKSDVEAVKDLLDAANNACAGPTPTPAVAGVGIGPTDTPSGLPDTGSPPDATASWLRILGIAVALLALGGLALTAGRKTEQ
jgi:hypothetical protein